eukprot:5178732-Pyramimonas_sp.AAC.1
MQLDQVRSRAPHRLPFPRLSALAVWWRRVAYAFHCLSFWHSPQMRQRALNTCNRLLQEAEARFASALCDARPWLCALGSARDVSYELACVFETGARARA